MVAILDLIEEYEQTKKMLMRLYKKHQNNPFEREIVSSMINEVSEVIQRLQGYEIAEKKKRTPWSPEWMERLSVPSFEDEVVARLDGELDEWDDHHLTIDFACLLTDRQLEIVQLIADGYSRSKVAEMLGVEKGTVNQTMRTIRQKGKQVESMQMTLI